VSFWEFITEHPIYFLSAISAGVAIRLIGENILRRVLKHYGYDENGDEIK
jgi:hypothetical protein